jgi:hypothetical protein
VVLREDILNRINGGKNFRVTPPAESLAFNRKPALELGDGQVSMNAVPDLLGKLM